MQWVLFYNPTPENQPVAYKVNKSGMQKSPTFYSQWNMVNTSNVENLPYFEKNMVT